MDNITVVIPTSPIPSHPSTEIIDETIKSVRNHLPYSDIILQIDGIHQKYQSLEDNYEEYKKRVLWKCLHDYKNVLPITFSEYSHQSNMMRASMPKIKTDYILYVEGDTPFNDRPIDWKECINWLDEGKATTIRFHFEESIPEPHRGLMIGGGTSGFQKTIQWSQRPHLSTRVYYQDMIKEFPEDSPSFIEDYWHGRVQQDYYESGIQGWYKHRLWIYHKKDRLGIKRTYTTDGRQGMPKVGEGF